MNIFEFIEKDDFNGFKDYLKGNPESILDKDEDNWSVISLLVHYDMPEYVEHILPMLTLEDLNKSTPLHPLFVALEDKDTNFIKLLSKYDNVDFSFTYKNNENIIHYLLYRDYPEVALELLENNKLANVFTISNDNKQLLNIAIEKKYHDIIDFITSQIVFEDNFNESLIFDSIRFNNFDAFEKLYPYYDIDKIDSIFNFAIQNKDTRVINYIINSGDILLGKEQIKQILPIIAEIHVDKEKQEASNEIIDFLFSIKTNFNSFINSSGENIWMLAIQKENDYLFNKLVNENNENLNFEDINQQTPLFFAIEQLNVDYVKKILKRKANPNHTDYLKNNSLLHAINQECLSLHDLNNKLEIVKELLKYRADFNQKNINEDSALSLAVYKKQMDIVTELLWKGADLSQNPAKFINSQDVFQINASGSFEKLDTLSQEKTIDNFLALKQLGFDLSQKNSNNDSFAMFFIKDGYLANFLALLPLLNDYQINEIDSNGNSLLMNAIKKKNDEFALNTLFLFKNIDLDVVNKNNETVYSLCADYGNSTKMEALINNDDNLTSEKIRFALPLILKQGNISQYWNDFVKIDPSIVNFKDQDNNNLFMICASNANFKNIDFLFSQEINYTLKDINNQKQTLMDILISLPEEHENDVARTLDYFKKSSKKKP